MSKFTEELNRVRFYNRDIKVAIYDLLDRDDNREDVIAIQEAMLQEFGRTIDLKHLVTKGHTVSLKVTQGTEEILIPIYPKADVSVLENLSFDDEQKIRAELKNMSLESDKNEALRLIEDSFRYEHNI